MRHLRIQLIAVACLVGFTQPSFAEFDAAPAAAPAISDVAATAPAATPAPPAAEPAPADTKPSSAIEDVDNDPVGFIGEIIESAREKNWRILISLLLVALMWVANRFRDKTWFKGDRGGAILVAGLGLSAGMIGALQSGAPIDWKLMAGVMVAVWTAVGGVTWFKRIIWPKDSKETT
jgi:hypothetical protein